MTASLTNFIWSLVWGAGLVLIPGTIALILISQKDKVTRRG
jgi:photosystem II PsbX protein